MSIPAFTTETFYDDALDTLRQKVNGVTDGTVPIPVAGIEAALGAYEPLQGALNGRILLSSLGIFPSPTDLTSTLQDVINAYPGHEIAFDRKGDYRADSRTSSVLNFCLYVNTDNTWLVGVPGARLITAEDAALVYWSGPNRNQSGFPAWSSRWLPNIALLPMTGSYSKGGVSITLTTPADAADLEPGEIIAIVSGNLGIGANEQPDGEFNEVLTADGGTGVVTLRYPLSKPYQPENYISGSTGFTEPGGGGTAAPYGIRRVDPSMLRNVGIRGLDLVNEETTDVPWHAYQVWGFHMADMRIDAKGSNGNPYYMRDYSFRRMDIRIDKPGESSWILPLGATMQSDGVAEDIRGVSNGSAYLHFHEGGANIHARRVNLLSTGEVNGVHQVGFRSRGYDLSLLDSKLSHLGDYNAIYADPTVTGGVLVDGCEIHTSGADACFFAGPNQVWGPNNRILENKNFSFLNPVGSGTAIAGGAAPITMMVLSQWVSDSNPIVDLGELPAYSRIIEVFVQVEEAFNSDGTDLLEVGDTSDPDRYAAAIDVSTTGIKTVTLLNGGYNDTSRTIRATYTAGGSAASTGRAFVSVTYSRVARKVNT